MIDIDADIRRAATLPAGCYTDPEFFARACDRVFARSWQFVGDVDRVADREAAHPFLFLDAAVPEPLVLTRSGDGALFCLSNVCTHRGNLVVDGPCRTAELKCRYHGRRFGLDGAFLHMPEFEETRDFPSERDHLARVPLERWGRLLFTALDPAVSFEEWIDDVRRRVGWLPLDDAVLHPERSRDYEVKANWALYCDNYLEGFHIPFVHGDLTAELDYGAYETELHRYSNVQIGIASDDDHVFDLPAASPDHGKRVAAYYYWLFPNLMLNLYPWGISVNIVRPLAVDRTRVSFRSYVWDRDLLDRGASADLDKVEREDEEIVEAVQQGMRSRIYERGRYSPTREQGVHHFHRLLAMKMRR